VTIANKNKTQFIYISFKSVSTNHWPQCL